MQGTLDLLILKALSLEPMHGWGITNRIQRMSQGTFQIGQGSMYPALHRSESRGWVTSYLRAQAEKSLAQDYHPTQARQRAVGGWVAPRAGSTPPAGHGCFSR